MPDGTSRTKPLRVGVGGALGRMGRAVAAVLAGRAEVVVAAAFDRPGTEGEIVHGRKLGPSPDIDGCDVVIDFSTPAPPGGEPGFLVPAIAAFSAMAAALLAVALLGKRPIADSPGDRDKIVYDDIGLQEGP